MEGPSFACFRKEATRKPAVLGSLLGDNTQVFADAMSGEKVEHGESRSKAIVRPMQQFRSSPSQDWGRARTLNQLIEGIHRHPQYLSAMRLDAVLVWKILNEENLPSNEFLPEQRLGRVSDLCF